MLSYYNVELFIDLEQLGAFLGHSCTWTFARHGLFFLALYILLVFVRPSTRAVFFDPICAQ